MLPELEPHLTIFSFHFCHGFNIVQVSLLQRVFAAYLLLGLCCHDYMQSNGLSEKELSENIIN